MIQYRESTVVILLLLFTAFTMSPRGQQFTYTFSMESINNFRVTLQLNPDSSWMVARYNYFFDRFGGSSSVLERDGKLTDQEHAAFVKLLKKSGIEFMKESYGFDSEENIGCSVIYMLSLTPEGGKTLYINIRENAEDRFSDAFREMILYSSLFLNNKLETDSAY